MQVTRHERGMRRTPGESANVVAAVVKCAVLLGFIALLALIGSGAGVIDGGAPLANTAGHQSTSAPTVVRAEAHRKQLFDERRARYEANAPARLALKPDQNGRRQVNVP